VSRAWCIERQHPVDEVAFDKCWTDYRNSWLGIAAKWVHF
jgi:hypothetical protein